MNTICSNIGDIPVPYQKFIVRMPSSCMVVTFCRCMAEAACRLALMSSSAKMLSVSARMRCLGYDLWMASLFTHGCCLLVLYSNLQV